MNEEVTWKARHFGVWQYLTVRVTEYNRPYHFQDIMVKGAFSIMKHDHHFQEDQGGMIMTDRFEFAAPLGIFGKIAESLILTRYMRSFLQTRNQILKSLAESDDWRSFLSPF